MEDQTYQQTYANRDDPARIPVVVIIGDHVPDNDADELGCRQWTANDDQRPVIMVRESEAKQLAAEMFAAVYRLERARNA